MRGVAAAAALVAACYHAPSHDAACGITCSDGACPGDMTCEHGVCIAPGDSCDPTFRDVFASPTFACALDSRDALWCWGSNVHHQLDGSDRTAYPYAMRVGTDRWDTLSVGGGHVCGIRGDALYCWGQNDRGQVAGTVIGDVAAPLAIATSPAVTKWTAVAAGLDYTCAIGDGSVYCWGAGDSGQLGNGNGLTSAPDEPEPTLVVPMISDFTAIATGHTHSCAISAQQGVYCWGSDGYGQIGVTATGNFLAPVAVALDEPAVDIAVGRYHTCAVTAGGHLECWGYNYESELGDPQVVTPPTIPTSPTPIASTNLDGWTHVVAGQRQTCALRADEVWCWGYHSSGGFGTGLWSESSVWERVATGASAIAVGYSATMRPDGNEQLDFDLTCLVTDGVVSCAGDNRYGQLGVGAESSTDVPTEIAGGHTWSTLVAGAHHICGVDETGTLQCWGATTSGQANGVELGQTTACGVPGEACDVLAPAPVPTVASADELALGFAHTCVRAGTAITCWGDNGQGQLGAADPGNAPRAVPGTWDALADVRGQGACGTSAGQTQCWGNLIYIAASAPVGTPDLDGMSQIGTYAGSYAFGCMLDAANGLSCFGDNSRGQFGNGVVRCGDGLCGPGEDTTNCPGDCNAGPVTCGNGVCDGGENCTTCGGDCGACPINRLSRVYTSLSVGWGDLNQNRGYACGVRPDQVIECWGNTALGQAGVITTYAYHPNPISELTNCTAVSAADTHTCGLCGGHIACWGDARFGALGSSRADQTMVIPSQVAEPADGGTWVDMTSGVGFTCARSSLGHGYCWGAAAHGALGTGVASSNLFAPVQLAP